ncbi:MAG TPA: site-specific integrase, partial [Acidimicrobiales bacterium]|nr:site-specific integrase [Acidimicrobiales bacterium]
KIRAWHSRLHADHPATAAGAYRLLSAICKTAVVGGIIPNNPCRVSGASVERPKRRPVASVPDVARAVAAAPERFRLALLLAAWCQLRRGEVLGLQRADVNPLKGTVTITRTWTTSGEGPPKTEAGWRVITMPEPVVTAMRQHLDHHVGQQADAWLFPGAGGKPVAPRTLDRVWTEAREAAGLPALRLHDLRHSGLTWTAEAGASVAELMYRAGHSSPAAAMRYQHATQTRDEALAKALSMLARAKPQTRADKTGTVDAE